MKAQAYVLAICLLASAGCVDEEATARLDSATEAARASIEESLFERESSGEDSVLHALVSLRLAIQQQTLAMLEQKRAAAYYYPRFSYTVNGESYAPPDDVDQIIEGLEGELKKARAEWEQARKEASSAEGVMGGLALMEAETRGLLVGQLEYQLIAYKHGFPPLVVPMDPASSSSEGAMPLTASRGSRAKPLQLPAGSSAREKEMEAMEAAISVRLVDKTYRRSDAVAGTYAGRLRLEFEYGNRSGKDIRAFTGSVVFMDLFDREFLRVSLTVDDPISAGRVLSDNRKQLKISKFKEAHQKLLATKTEDLRTRFEPQSILFADGTRLGSVSP